MKAFWIALAGVLPLAACSAREVYWGERGNPITAADLAPLPEQVTESNAEQVVRMCLQRHAASTGEPALVRYDYVWGFEPVLRVHPGFTRTTLKGDLERTEGVEFRAIIEVSVLAPGEIAPTWGVRLYGGFTSGAGGAVYGWIHDLVLLPCLDEATARKLEQAIRHLKAKAR